MSFKYTLPLAMTRAMVGISAISQTVTALLAVPVSASFGHGIWAAGLLFSAYYILNIFVCLAAGRLMERFGRQHALCAGLAVYAVAAAAFSRMTLFPLALVCFALMGAGAALVTVTGLELAAVLSGRGGAGELIVTNTLLGIALVAGAAYATLMLNYGLAWRETYLFWGIAVGVLALIYTILPMPKLPPIGNVKAELRSVLQSAKLYPAYLAVLLYTAAEVTATGWLAGYMTRGLGYTTLIAGLALILMWICVTVGRLLCLRLLGSVPVRALIGWMTLLLALSLCLCLIVTEGRLFWLAILGIGLGLSGLGPLTASLAYEQHGGDALVQGLSLAGSLGAAVVPFLAGLLGGRFGMRWTLGVAVLLFFASCLTVQWIVPQKRKRIRPRE